jgi:hypothetical protein
MSAETDTSELEMNLRNILNEKFSQGGGKKRRGSRKGSKKGSKKHTGGMWGKKKATGGKRRSRKASSKKASKKMTGGKRRSRKASSKKGSKKGSRARRALPPAMIAFGKIRAHVMKKLGVKMTIALQIAKKVRDEVMSKHPNITDHDEIAKKAIEHFNANEAKFSAKASRM